jgi:hypothetical protein
MADLAGRGVRDISDVAEDITQAVLLSFAQHPDWFAKGDSYIWERVQQERGHYFRDREKQLRGGEVPGRPVYHYGLRAGKPDYDSDTSGSSLETGLSRLDPEPYYLADDE